MLITKLNYHVAFVFVITMTHNMECFLNISRYCALFACQNLVQKKYQNQTVLNATIQILRIFAN